jgi:hypothetical protein
MLQIPSCRCTIIHQLLLIVWSNFSEFSSCSLRQLSIPSRGYSERHHFYQEKAVHLSKLLLQFHFFYSNRHYYGYYFGFHLNYYCPDPSSKVEVTIILEVLFLFFFRLYFSKSITRISFTLIYFNWLHLRKN